MVCSFTHCVSTRGEGQVLDLTPTVLRSIAESGIRQGTASLFVPGSTAGLTTIAVSYGYSQVPVADLGASYVIERFSDLRETLSALS